MVIHGRPNTKQHAAIGVEPRDLGDPGTGANIETAQSGYIKIVSTGAAETNTLDDPQFLGQILDFFFETDGGDRVITADSAYNQNGDTTMTFADAGDHIRLVGGRAGGGAFEWREIANDGVARG